MCPPPPAPGAGSAPTYTGATGVPGRRREAKKGKEEMRECGGRPRGSFPGWSMKMRGRFDRVHGKKTGRRYVMKRCRGIFHWKGSPRTTGSGLPRRARQGRRGRTIRFRHCLRIRFGRGFPRARGRRVPGPCGRGFRRCRAAACVRSRHPDRGRNPDRIPFPGSGG